MKNRRILVLGLIVAAVFAVLTVRLVSIQLIHGADYRKAAEENRLLIKETASQPNGIFPR